LTVIIIIIIIIINLTSFKLISTHLTLSQLGCAEIGRSHGNWVVRCETTQFAVAATNHSELSSDEMRSDEVRCSEYQSRD